MNSEQAEQAEQVEQAEQTEQTTRNNLSGLSGKQAKNPEKGIIGPCGHRISYIVDSRICNKGKGIRRRRACHICKERWTTYEGPADQEDKLRITVQAANKMLATVVNMKQQIEEFIRLAGISNDDGMEDAEVPVGEKVPGLSELSGLQT